MGSEGNIDIPPEFLDPEDEGESQDPDLKAEESGFEALTSTLRQLWAEWMCRRGKGAFADIEFFGRHVGGVPKPAVDAYRALEMALAATGYQPTSRWAYNCRKIKGTNSYSLHSAGIAIDIDPQANPYTHGDKYSGKLQPHHVAAVLAIKNHEGESIWSWGGNWNKPDRMHFQLDQGPEDVDVDWKTVSGDIPADYISEEGNVLRQGDSGKAVTRFQEQLLVWDPTSLPEWGADGEFGKETTDAVKRFQEENGLQPTGVIDGVTAVLLQMP